MQVSIRPIADIHIILQSSENTFCRDIIYYEYPHLPNAFTLLKEVCCIPSFRARTRNPENTLLPTQFGSIHWIPGPGPELKIAVKAMTVCCRLLRIGCSVLGKCGYSYNLLHWRPYKGCRLVFMKIFIISNRRTLQRACVNVMLIRHWSALIHTYIIE